MDKIIVIVIIIVLCLIGFYQIIKRIKSFNEKYTFAIEYLDALKSYLESNGQDIQSYSWLINRSNKMQNQMGSQGILGFYHPPYQNFAIPNYPLILNMLPDLRNALCDSYLSSSLAGQYSSTLQEAIIRHIGSIEDAISIQKKYFKNPFVWLRQGIRILLSLPANLLNWLGIITVAAVNKYNSSIIYKILYSIITIIGLISAIMTIVLGWNDFLSIIKALIY